MTDPKNAGDTPASSDVAERLRQAAMGTRTISDDTVHTTRSILREAADMIERLERELDKAVRFHTNEYRDRRKAEAERDAAIGHVRALYAHHKQWCDKPDRFIADDCAEVDAAQTFLDGRDSGGER